jgi:hypothetical protein
MKITSLTMDLAQHFEYANSYLVELDKTKETLQNLIGRHMYNKHVITININEKIVEQMMNLISATN